MFVAGIVVCALLIFACSRPEPKPPVARSSGGPRVCKYCGCADPFPDPDDREHRPENDPGLR